MNYVNLNAHFKLNRALKVVAKREGVELTHRAVKILYVLSQADIPVSQHKISLQLQSFGHTTNQKLLGELLDQYSEQGYLLQDDSSWPVMYSLTVRGIVLLQTLERAIRDVRIDRPRKRRTTPSRP
jgi:hypothetical protein